MRYGRDVAEPERLAVGEDRRLLNRRDALHRAADAQRHALRIRLELARGSQRILLRQRVKQRLQGNAERRELRVAEFNEDPLALGAVEIDLRDVGQPTQPLAQRFCDFLQLRVARAVANDRIKDGVNVAELVVDCRSEDIGRQVRLHVGHLFAQLEKEQRHVPRARGILEFEGNGDEPGLRVGLDLVDSRQLLQLLLDPVRHLPLHFGGGRAWPGGADVDVLDRERGVLGAAQLRIGQGAQRRDRQYQERDELRMPDRPIRKIEFAHQSPARFCTTRTFCLASSL